MIQGTLLLWALVGVSLFNTILLLWLGLTLWLAAGMTPVVLLPYVWYVVLLWYNGFWTAPAGELRRPEPARIPGLEPDPQPVA